MIQYDDVWTHSRSGIPWIVHLRPSGLRPTLRWLWVLKQRVELLPLHISVSRIKLQYVSAFVIQQSKGPSLGISQLTLIGVPTVSVLGCVRIHILQHHSSKQPKSTSTSTPVASFPSSCSPYHIANLLLKVLLKQWCTLGSNFWQSCSLFTKNKTKQRCFYFRNLSQVSS